MAFGLLKYGLSRRRPVKRFLSSRPELRPSYDVAIIGGGGHGLAAAYYLAARHGVRNVAVFDKGYLGGGNTGRNTAIIRSNYLTPEGVAFYEESMRLYRGLSEELDYNILYSEARALHPRALRCGHAHLTLAGRGEQASRRRFRGRRA